MFAKWKGFLVCLALCSFCLFVALGLVVLVLGVWGWLVGSVVATAILYANVWQMLRDRMKYGAVSTPDDSHLFYSDLRQAMFYLKDVRTGMAEGPHQWAAVDLRMAFKHLGAATGRRFWNSSAYNRVLSVCDDLERKLDSAVFAMDPRRIWYK